MTPPTVSVVLPTYNRAPLLARAIGSVLAQSYRDFELIVVDDCSTDSTEQELSRFIDPRIKVIRLSVNSGPSAARNAGIRVSVGKYIAFQDSDDEWFNDKLGKQIALIENSDKNGAYPAACYSRYVVLHGDKAIVVPPDPEETLSGEIYSRLLRGNTMGTPVMLLRKDVLDSIGGFDESISNLEDWDLALRAARGRTIAFLDEVTLTSYSTPGSVNKIVAPESLITILEKHLGSYQVFPRIMADMTWKIGSQYAIRHERDEARRYMRASLEQFPTTGRRLLFALLWVGLTPYKVVLSCRQLLRSTVASTQNANWIRRAFRCAPAQHQASSFASRTRR